MSLRLQASAEMRNTMDKAKISTVEELVYADLRRVGWNKSDAFYVAFRHLYGTYTRSQQIQVMNSLEEDPDIKARMAGLKEGKNMLSLDEIAKETSKEKLLSDLLIARSKTKQGSKEWIDITAKIADYAKIKQDDIKTDEKPIRYHLPVHYPRTCKDCLIYQNGKQIKAK